MSISSALNNNTFTFTIYPGEVFEYTYTITIPDGAYNVSDLNSYFKYWSIQNGLYMINDASGEYGYFAAFVVNSVKYAVEVLTYSSLLPVGWSLAPTFPAAAGPVQPWNPVLTFPSGFNLIVGYAAGFSTSANLGVGTTLGYLSSIAPQVQPNSSVLVSCNSIQNKYAQSPIIYAFSSAGTGFGELILSGPSQLSFSPLMSGMYSELRVQLLGTNLMPLSMLDPNITILLVIQENI
jgi:hypothetical protein